MKGKMKLKQNSFLLLVTILLFFIMYGIGCVLFNAQAFQDTELLKPLYFQCGSDCHRYRHDDRHDHRRYRYQRRFLRGDGLYDVGMDDGKRRYRCGSGGSHRAGDRDCLRSGTGIPGCYMDIQPFIVTLAGMFFARGMTAIISKDMISITNETFMAWAKMKLYIPFGGYLNKKGMMIYPYIYPTVVIALVLLVLAFIMLKYTKFGRSIYAIGGNEQSALMMA